MYIRRRFPGIGWVALTGLAFVLLRLPSFAEPAWYSDEGIYASIGWALDHGARLYVDVWDNKPPGVYWVAALLLRVLPPTLIFPVAATVLAAASTLLVGWIGGRLGGRRVGLLAAGAFAVASSLPNLQGNLFNAEVCGATLTAAAIALLVERPSRVRAYLSGALVGAGVLFKATVTVDVVVVAGLPMLLAWGRRGEGHEPRWRPALAGSAAVLSGAATALAVAGVILASQGSLGGAVSMLVGQDVAYVGAFDGRSAGPVLGAIALAIRVGAPVAIGGIVEIRFARRRRPGPMVAGWWLGWDAAAAMVSSRGFPHYAQQAEPALALAGALVVQALWGRVPGVARGAPWTHSLAGRAEGAPWTRVHSGAAPRARWSAIVTGVTWRAAPAAATAVLLIVATVALAWLPGAEAAILAGRPIPGVRVDGVSAAQVPSYYLDGCAALVDSGARDRFADLFPVNLDVQGAAVAALQADSTPGDTVFVWGSIPWAYVLSGRMPAGRYVSLNAAYWVDPRAPSVLQAELRHHPPRAVVAVDTPPDWLLSELARGHYEQVSGAADGANVWLRPGSATHRHAGIVPA